MSRDSNEISNFLASGSVGLLVLCAAGAFFLTVKGAELLTRMIGRHPLSVPLIGMVLVTIACAVLAFNAGGQDLLLDVLTVVSAFITVSVAKFLETADEQHFLPEVNRGTLATSMTEPWWDLDEAA